MIRRNRESVGRAFINLAYCPGFPAFEVDKLKIETRLYVLGGEYSGM